MNLLSFRRRGVSLALGALLAVAVLKLAACSAIDPVPPDPHLIPELILVVDMLDASDAEAAP
jgi:hypothetical protein